MRLILTALALTVVVAACGSEISRGPHATAPPLVPLPANLSGIPGPTDVTVLVEPHSPAGELTFAGARNFQLGHCGLSSPIDIDGSLWDPIASYFLLTEEHKGELINSTPTSVLLSDYDLIELHTPAGALIYLQRHDGPRPYFLCD